MNRASGKCRSSHSSIEASLGLFRNTLLRESWEREREEEEKTLERSVSFPRNLARLKALREEERVRDAGDM